MTTTPGLPPERQSLYPEPHRADNWGVVETKRAPRLWILLVVGAGIGALALVIWGGLEFGRFVGSSDVSVEGTDSQTVNAIQVVAGTCLSTLPDSGRVAEVEAIRCDIAHEAEAVAEYTFTVDEWPGRDQAVSTLLDYCGSVIQPGYSGSSMFTATDWDAGLRWVAWVPTEDGWGEGERTGTCVVYRDGKMSGSFVDRSATFVN